MGGAEAHRVVPVLKQVGASVVLAPLAFPPTDRGLADDGEIRLDTAARLAVAGVPLALSAVAAGDAVTLREAAGLAIRGGLARDAALAAITRGAAEILGVGAEVGTLAVGRAADLVVCTGDPLEPTTRVRAVVVDGTIVWGPE